MGMAASQARYLALTARKTNTEYEGQQINQERTALANQSADAFNQYLALEVPTAPSTQDYTTIQYTYQDGNVEEAIESMTELADANSDYNYLVTHYHYSDVFTGVRNTKINPQVRTGYETNTNTIAGANVTQDGANFQINGYTVNPYDENNVEQKSRYDVLSDQIAAVKTIDKNNLGVYTDDQNVMHFVDMSTLAAGTDATDYSIDATATPQYIGNTELTKYEPGKDKTLDLSLEQIRKDNPDDPIATAENIYTYESYGRTYFVTEDELMASANSSMNAANPSEYQANLNTYYAEAIKTKISSTDKAFVEFDDTGRMTSINYENSTATFTVQTETITDQAAYQDAMNQYEYDKAQYEKAVQDINAKTEIIQEEDRTLELRLKQLDTEQNALQTEMEAVAKVIDKNVEMTFKTFSS